MPRKNLPYIFIFSFIKKILGPPLLCMAVASVSHMCKTPLIFLAWIDDYYEYIFLFFLPIAPKIKCASWDLSSEFSCGLGLCFPLNARTVIDPYGCLLLISSCHVINLKLKVARQNNNYRIKRRLKEARIKTRWM